LRLCHTPHVTIGEADLVRPVHEVGDRLGYVHIGDQPAGQARSFEDLLERARGWTTGSGRHVLGIAGAPGAGKTTLVEALVRALRADDGAETVAHVPMDGFHLADVELTRLGRLERKGAPDTFDPAGYAALLERVRQPREDETVYAPAFDRDLEQPLAGAVPVLPECRLVITEGNYLDHAVRRERLVARHVRFGKAPDAAAAWVDAVDEPNAVRVSATRSRADVVVLGPVALPGVTS
jgi:pantothenate kinase